MKRLTFIFILTLISVLGKSQSLSFRHYGIKEGLKSNTIYTLCQDNDGYIWIGSYGNGVFRFDGTTFEHYTEEDGLPSDYIRVIKCDSTGAIWAGGDYGISKFNGNNFEQIKLSYSIQRTNVTDILFLGKNKMWVATTTGLVIINNGFVNCFKHYNKILITTILKLYQDSENNVWLCTRGFGVIKISLTTKKISFVSMENNITSGMTTSITEMHGNEMWVGTPDGITIYKNNLLIRTLTESNGLINTKVQTIYTDNTGKTWIGTGKGISICEKNVFTSVGKTNGLDVNLVRCFLKDSEGNTWIGSQESGLWIYSDKKITNYSAKNGLNGNKPQCFLIDNQKNKWIATETGLNKIDLNGNIFSYTKEDGLFTENITSLAMDSLNNIWIGTLDNGVYKFDGKQFKNYSVRNISSYNSVSCIYADSKKKLWFGNRSCVFNIINDTAVRFNSIFKFYNSYINKIIEGKNNELIFCTGGGISIAKDTNVWNYNTLEVLPKGMSEHIDKDYKGNYWISSVSGLTLYDYKKFRTITRSNGLPTRHITSIKAHGRFLYLGSIIGLIKIDLEKYYNYNTISYQVISAIDGLSGNECISSNMIADELGRIWVGTENAVSVYDPYMDKDTKSYPKLLLNSVKLFNETTDWKTICDSVNSKNIPYKPQLNYTQNDLTFDFVGLLYKSPDKVKYSYLLEGANSKWSAFTTEHKINFSNLPPGDYVFKIKATNVLGEPSKEELQFPFSILPPFWKTFWFGGIILIAITLSVIISVKIREQNLRKQNILLEEKVIIRTQQLSSEKVKTQQANEELQYKNQLINDSIEYAGKIQESILPSAEQIEKMFDKKYSSFIFNHPKDIIGGDFFWMHKQDEHIYIAVVDCTGHGVPGALMSMTAHNMINRVILSKKITEPHLVLNELNRMVIDFFSKNNKTDSSKSGFEIGLCKINTITNELMFAGSFHTAIISGNGKFNELKSGKKSIGFIFDKKFSFTTHRSMLNKGDSIYMFTDGLIDQKGGFSSKRLGTVALHQLIAEASLLTTDEQKKFFENYFDRWKGLNEQIDDVLLLGIKLT